MPTPTGQISMDDMRVNINRATASAISMSEMRARYGGGAGQINFSDLRNSEGFTINPTNYTFSSKYVNANQDGWSSWTVMSGVFGSVSPAEANGMVQVAANSYIRYLYEDNNYSPGTTSMGISASLDPNDVSGDPTAGYKGTNVNRLVIGNTSYTITATANQSASVSYNMPTTGTLHCLVKFV